MIGEKEIKVHTLPDIEMYGGDTNAWEITIMQDSGTTMTPAMISECEIVLSLIPFKVSFGVTSGSVASTPILTKTGTLVISPVDDPVFRFEFSENDTKQLRGKFIYQIEVRHEDDIRLCQGNMYIKQNINR